jgi:hypothetical protein
MERLVFERSLELATELGLLDGSVEQIVDSTPMLGAGHGDLVRAAVRKLIDAVRATDKEAAGELRRGLRFDYSKPRVKPEGDWQNPDARMQLLAQVATDAARALHVVETDGELMAGDEIAEAARLLARSSVRSSRSHMTRSRGRVAGVECATSSRRMIPRCAMVARPRQSGLPATSCTPRRRPRRRS